MSERDTRPCDAITCINRIPRDEYMAAQERIKEKTGEYGLVMCGNCTQAPEGHWLHDLAEMDTLECISIIEEIIDDAAENRQATDG